MRLTTRADPGVRGTRQMSRSRRLMASAAVLVSLGLVFVLDQATGSAPVQHLYYLPIVYAAFWFGIRGGIAVPFAAIALYHAANPRLLTFEHEHWDVVQVALFLAVGLATAKFTDDRHRLQVLATTDDLTGLHNLRSFETRLEAMVRSCREARDPLAVLVLDVDRLKSLNDAHGHLVGAEAVRVVGHIIGAQLPADAVACRYGGDEFVIALPHCNAASGRAVADELRRAVHARAPVLAGLSFPTGALSVSVGVACQTFDSRDGAVTDTERGEELFRVADRALYEAKEFGRNQVLCRS